MMNFGAFPSQRDDLLGNLDPVSSRVSLMAVTSLVLGILCCIPGSGLVATIFGIVAILFITKSAGRLTGRGLAVTGLVLGLFGTIGWVAIGSGALAFTNSVRDTYGRAMVHLAAGDRAEISKVLTTEADAALTPERLKDFNDKVAAEWGTFQRMPLGLGEWAGDYMAVFGTFGQVSQVGFPYPPGAPGGRFAPNPLPMRFDKGLVCVITIMDQKEMMQTAGGQPFPKLANIGVIDSKRQIIWLVDPVVSAPAPAPTPAPTPAPAPAPAAPAAEAPKAETPKAP
jgi:hypothetical protein